MKKLVSIILSLVLCGSFLCSAAEEAAEVTDMPVAGLSMRWPLQFFRNERFCICGRRF